MRAGGEIFFAQSCSASFLFFFLLNRLLVFNHVTDAVRFVYQIIGKSNFALRKLSYFPTMIMIMILLKIIGYNGAKTMIEALGCFDD